VKNRKFIINLIYLALTPFIFIVALLLKKRRKKIIWGPIPMMNYKYHSKAIKKLNYYSETLVSNYYKIHTKNDFDKYYLDLFPSIFNKLNTRILNKIVILFGPILSFIYVIKNASILNISFYGGYLGDTILFKLEILLYKFFKIKTVVNVYGGDAFMYSKILDNSLKHALMISYPEMSIKENKIQKKINFLNRNADIIITAMLIDGIGKWSCLPVNMLCIDDKIINHHKKFKKKESVTILHAPNHTGFKGTEFIIKAIEDLIDEGYNINFYLIEKRPNREVLEKLRNEADILVEQLIYSGYSLNAIEGMASGVPVLSNLENETYTKLFRRYSFLDECPVLSTSPETIKTNLKLLIENKKLRVELGELGIKYVKKYHSEKSAQYLYGKIFNQLLNGVDEDLINMYHPLKSEYVKQNFIKTPLVNNQYLG